MVVFGSCKSPLRLEKVGMVINATHGSTSVYVNVLEREVTVPAPPHL